MAIGVRRINSTDDLKEALEASGLFSSVSYGTGSALNAYDEDSNLILSYFFKNNYNRLSFNYASGSYATSGTTYCTNIDVAYYTAKGIMLKARDANAGNAIYCWLLTKDNNGKIVFVYVPHGANTDHDYGAIRYTTNALDTRTYTETSNNQTALVPFVVSINDGEARSYTPDAFWIPISENYNIGWCAITIEGVQYVTNGHFALKDTEVV